MRIRAWMAIAVLSLPLLHACGGGGGSDGGSGALRLVNAADGYASLDLYADDTQIASAVTSDSAGDYVSLGSSAHTFKLKRNGSSTTSSSSSRTIGADTSYTLLAYSTAESLRTVLLSENEAAPTTGTAKLRVFNASTEAGSVDVYVIDPAATLDESSATVTSLATERISSYNEIGAGSYRVVVTGAGDKSDLRLDLSSVSLTDQQITTLVLTATPGGVLVHGLTLDQKGSVAAKKNPSARVRLVAGANANGSVSAEANGVALSSAGVVSPAIGSYMLVPAGALTLDVKVNGTAATSSATSLTAGSDNTLLVTGDATAATATLIGDDNTPALSSTKAKIRLINGVPGSSAMSLTANSSLVATDVAFGTATTPALISATTGVEIQVTSPTGGLLFDKTDQTITATYVYTVFMLTGTSGPTGTFLRDR